MSEQTIAAIALAISIFIAHLYYKNIKNNGTKKQKFIAKAEKNGNVTTGIAEDTERILGDSDGESYRSRQDKLQVRYKYQVNGITYHKYLRFIGSGRAVSIKYPTEIKLYYDANNPKKALYKEEASEYHQRQTGCLGAAAIWFVLMVILVNLLKALLS